MTVDNLYSAVTGITGIRSVEFADGMSQAAATASVTCTAHTLTVGDVVDVAIGYVGNYRTVIKNGIVKSIAYRRPEHNYVVTIHDVLSLAVDYFIASDDPDNPLQFVGTSPSDAIDAILALATITDFVGSATTPTFIFGLADNPMKINLVSAWAAIEQINRITGYVTYADPETGTVYFAARKPYLVGGDVTDFELTTGPTGNIQNINYTQSDEHIRNRVVVYGYKDITKTLVGSSAYLPVGFYQTMVVAHEWIANQQAADNTATVNLTMFNRLTETLSITAKGDPNATARTIAEVTESFTGLSAEQFVVFATRHNVSKDGYSMDLTLVR